MGTKEAPDIITGSGVIVNYNGYAGLRTQGGLIWYPNDDLLNHVDETVKITIERLEPASKKSRIGFVVPYEENKTKRRKRRKR